MTTEPAAAGAADGAALPGQHVRTKFVLRREPLAAMGVKEAAMILDLVRDLKDRGEVAVIIIAHNYGQVLEVADRVNLLQQGQITFDKKSSETSVVEPPEMVVAKSRRALEERRSASGPG